MTEQKHCEEYLTEQTHCEGYLTEREQRYLNFEEDECRLIDRCCNSYGPSFLTGVEFENGIYILISKRPDHGFGNEETSSLAECGTLVEAMYVINFLRKRRIKCVLFEKENDLNIFGIWFQLPYREWLALIV